MTPAELRERTFEFGLSIMRLVRTLPANNEGWVFGKQLLRSGTSVGANNRAACRARTRREFIAKMGIVEEEADETLYWMKVLSKSGLVSQETVSPITREGDWILAVVVKSIRTARHEGRPR
jgi:four helix bundle protein